jgi:hypothetical protein
VRSLRSDASGSGITQTQKLSVRTSGSDIDHGKMHGAGTGRDTVSNAFDDQHSVVALPLQLAMKTFQKLAAISSGCGDRVPVNFALQCNVATPTLRTGLLLWGRPNRELVSFLFTDAVGAEFAGYVPRSCDLTRRSNETFLAAPARHQQPADCGPSRWGDEHIRPLRSTCRRANSITCGGPGGAGLIHQSAINRASGGVNAALRRRVGGGDRQQLRLPLRCDTIGRNG